MIFLRPWAFLLILVLPILYRLMKRYEIISNPWHKYVDAVFLKYLSVGTNGVQSSRAFKYLLPFVWILMTVALSGPAFEKLPVAGIENASPTVLVVDLNTLNQEKSTLLRIKLYELTEALKENSVGLVLYDTKGYVAAPLTSDKELIKALIPSLKQNIMPDQGYRLEKGVEKAVELFQNIQSKSGRILILTGGTPDITKAKKLLQNQPYTVGILGLGDSTPTPILTRDGAFLRDLNGQLVLAAPDKNQLEKLGVYRQTTPSGEEIKQLIDQTNPLNTDLFSKSNESSFLKPDVWHDLGVYAVCAALPFMALLFRKGIFFLWLTALCVGVSGEAFAGLWLRADQENYRTLKEANQLYRQGNYEQALRQYETVPSAEALYNKANALAHLKSYQEAIDLYGQVLKENPNHQDAAFNKKYLEEQLKQNQAQSNNQNSDSQDKNQSDQSDQKNQSDQTDESNQKNQSDSSDGTDQSSDETQNQSADQNQQNSQQNETQQNEAGQNQVNQEQNDQQNTAESSDLNESENQEQNSDSKSNETGENHSTGQSQTADEETSSDQPDADGAVGEETENQSDEPDQEMQQIMNRLQKDPARVLRYRLRKQYLSK